MSLEEFKAWERKCLEQAVTNAVRLLARDRSPAAAAPATREAAPDAKASAAGIGLGAVDAAHLSRRGRPSDSPRDVHP
jgi:hypothetical protein